LAEFSWLGLVGVGMVLAGFDLVWFGTHYPITDHGRTKKENENGMGL